MSWEVVRHASYVTPDGLQCLEMTRECDYELADDTMPSYCCMKSTGWDMREATVVSGGSAFALVTDVQNAAMGHKPHDPRALGSKAMAHCNLNRSSILVILAFDVDTDRLIEELVASLQLTVPVSQVAYRIRLSRVKDTRQPVKATTRKTSWVVARHCSAPSRRAKSNLES